MCTCVCVCVCVWLQVMVESNGFKFGIVKYIGTTEFAPGEWVGVALEKTQGESCTHTMVSTGYV